MLKVKKIKSFRTRKKRSNAVHLRLLKMSKKKRMQPLLIRWGLIEGAIQPPPKGKTKPQRRTLKRSLLKKRRKRSMHHQVRRIKSSNPLKKTQPEIAAKVRRVTNQMLMMRLCESAKLTLIGFRNWPNQGRLNPQHETVKSQWKQKKRKEKKRPKP